MAIDEGHQRSELDTPASACIQFVPYGIKHLIHSYMWT